MRAIEFITVELKMDLETSTKALGCLKNPKFLIFDGKQHPENFWFRGC